MDYEEHLTDDAHVIVAFAGGPQNVYQWGRCLARMGKSHVLMRDSTQLYHQHGVAGIGDREATAEYLHSLRFRGFKKSFSKLTLCGVSSGAYAALFYGILAPAAEVVVISPLSGRDLDDFDPKWHNQIVGPTDPPMIDLRAWYRDPNRFKPHVRAFISDGEATELDRQMAERIGVTDITLVPGYSHSALARGMRDLGMFEEIFR